MKTFGLIGLAGIALASTSLAQAADITEAEARRLQGVFEAYIGKPAPGEAGVVTVEPKADAYLVSIDFKRLMRPLEPIGLTLEALTTQVKIAPLPDGLWHVFDVVQPKIAYTLKEQSGTAAYQGLKYDSVFDPKTMATRSLTMSADAVESTSAAPGITTKGGYKGLTVTGAFEPAGQGVTGKVHYAALDIAQSMAFKDAKPGSGLPNFTLDLAAKTSSADVAVSAMKNAKLLEVWAFMVAHPSRDALAADEAAFKDLLRSLLPGFDAMAGAVQADAIAINTTFGKAVIGHVEETVQATGVSGDGSGEIAMKIHDLAITSNFIPAWANPVMPTVIEYGVKGAGFDLEAPARAFIEAFHVADPHLVSDEDAAAIIALFNVRGAGKIGVLPGRIKSALYDVSFEGEFQVPAGEGKPNGRVTVRATGLDKTIAALQAVKGVNGMQNVVTGLYAAKALSKPDANGSDLWVIDVDPAGVPTVNGQTLPGMGKK